MAGFLVRDASVKACDRLSMMRDRQEVTSGLVRGESKEAFSVGGHFTVFFIRPPDLNGFFGELRVRYFGPRPLIKDNSVQSGDSTVLNGRIGYEFRKRWTVAVEVFNILNAADGRECSVARWRW